MHARSSMLDVDALEFEDLKWALDYWREAAAGTWAPSWPDIDLSVFPASLLPRVCVVDVELAPLEFRYRYWGTAITDIHHYDLTGCLVSDLTPDHYARCLSEQYRQVVETRRPLGFITEIPLDAGRYTYYAALRAPLAGANGDVGHVLTSETYGGRRDELRELFEQLLPVEAVAGDA